MHDFILVTDRRHIMDLLLRYKTEHQLTWLQMAQLCNVTETTMYRWKAGTGAPGIVIMLSDNATISFQGTLPLALEAAGG